MRFMVRQLGETGLYQKYDELKPVNRVQINEFLLIKNFIDEVFI